MKLYQVEVRIPSSSIGVDCSMSYVVAANAEAAYLMVREYLYAKDLGFAADRELRAVRLLAEDTDYPECRTRLFVTPKEDA
jgi:hypothetical protein